MGKPLRVLMVEDSEDDVLLMNRALNKGGYDPAYDRVETAEDMLNALRKKPWDVILCDYQMPQFSGLVAIALLKEACIDTPLIIVSGTIGEDTAVECMRMGARDYIMKGNLSRLASAVERELKEAESRRHSKQADEALRESRNQIRTITDHVPALISYIDSDLHYHFANEFYAKIEDIPVTEIVGKHMREIMGEEYLIAQLKNIQTVLSGREVSFEAEHSTKKGKQLTLSVTYIPDIDSQGCAKGFYVFAADITERKRAERQLHDTLDGLKKAVNTTIQVMASAVEARDPYTAGHQIRSASLARAIATEMGLSAEKIEGVRMAASIHDIGKLSIPAEILSKPTKLSELEFSLIMEHSRKGSEMLKDVESPWLLAEIVYQHHERLDGSGYPRNLLGEEICMEARILAVADVVEAMASHRPYRPALGMDAALEEIEENRGNLYDNTVATACLRLFREKGFQFAT